MEPPPSGAVPVPAPLPTATTGCAHRRLGPPRPALPAPGTPPSRIWGRHLPLPPLLLLPPPPPPPAPAVEEAQREGEREREAARRLASRATGGAKRRGERERERERESAAPRRPSPGLPRRRLRRPQGPLHGRGARAEAAEDSAFVEAWKKVAPNIEVPKTPISLMQRRPPTPATIPTKLTVNFVLPYKSEIANKEVDKIIVPATTGQMGVLPGHVATIADLKPGVLSVHEENDVTKYLVNSGFAYVHANSIAEIVVVEAVPLD